MELEKLNKEVTEVITSLNDYDFPPLDFSLGKKTNEELIERVKKSERILYDTRKTMKSFRFHIALSLVKDFEHPKNRPYSPKGMSGECGDFVSIRPCGDEYKDNTYLGIYIGDIALGSYATIKEDKVITELSMLNPAIYVPELKKVIFGAESWWGKIKSEEDFRKITNEDIKNVWYVRVLEQMTKSKSEGAEEE